MEQLQVAGQLEPVKAVDFPATAITLPDGNRITEGLGANNQLRKRDSKRMLRSKEAR